MKNYTKIFLIIVGVFLILDGLLSIYFGHGCLNDCLNNNLFGDTVRVLRAAIGIPLIIIGVRK